MTDPLEPDTLPGETLVGTEHADVHFVYTHFPSTPVALPGRVRLTNVEEATLREHVGAWCAARSQAE